MLRFALALALLTAFSAGQWTQTSFILPDSLAGTSAYSIAYNPGNNTVFVGGSAVVVIDGVTQRRIARIPVSATRLLYAPAENKVYAISEYVVTVIDAAGLRVVGSFDMNENADWCYNPVMNRLYCVGDNYVSVVDCAADTLVARIRLPSMSRNICCAAPVNKVYCPMWENDDVAVVDCATDSVITTFYTGAGYYQTLYNPLSNRLYISETGDEDVTIVDCAGDSVIRWIPAGYGPAQLCLSTRQNRVYVADDLGDMFTVIDGAGDSLIGWRHLGIPQTQLQYDSTDDLVYIGLSYVDTLLVYDCRGDSVSARLAAPNRDLYGLAWAARENRVYATTYRGRVRVWAGGTSEVVASHDLWCDLSGSHWRTAADELYGVEPGDGFAVIDPELCQVVRRVPIPGNEAMYPAYNQLVDKVYCGRSLGAQDDLLVVRCAERDSLYRVRGVPAGVNVFAFDPTRPRTWCVTDNWNADSTLYVLDAQADTLVRRLPLGGTAMDVEFAPDLDRVFVPVPSERSVLVYDAASESLVGGIDVRNATKLLYVPGRQYLCVEDYSPTYLRVFDAVSGLERFTQLLSSSVGVMLHDPDADKVYIGFNGRPGLFVLHLDSLRLSAVQLPYDLLWMASDTVRHRLYLGSRSGDGVGVVDTRDDRLLTTLGILSADAGTWDPVRQRLLVLDRGRSELIVVEDTSLVGVRELPGVGIGRGRLATHVRGILRLPVQSLAPRLTLFTPDGRKVLDLKPGENDVSRLAPGIYFVRTASGVERDATSVTKVVVTR